MPVKILLADKSITIQKVVEMLFSGKEYEVTCVSDGETALSEASRIAPGVVLADVDLPRVDGYSFSARLRETPALAKVPVILMLSRDDQFDATKGKLSGIVDHIAKPFESQELIGKVKKALSTPAAPAAAAAVPARPAAAPPPPPKPAAAPPPPPPPVAAPTPKPAPAPPKQAVPSDIFGIIDEAPAAAAAAKSVAPPPSPPAPKPEPAPPPRAAEEFDVEPEFEVEVEPEAPAGASAPPPPAAAPVAPAAAEPFEDETMFGAAPSQAVPAAEPEFDVEAEIEAEVEPEAPAATVQGFDFGDTTPVEAEKALPLGAKAMEEMRQGLGLGEEPAAPGPEAGGHPDFVSFDSLDMASRVSHDDYAPLAEERPLPAAAPIPVYAPPPPSAAVSPPPAVSEEMLRAIYQDAVAKVAKEIIEQVAWEVIPELAERLIRDEIERLKAGS